MVLWKGVTISLVFIVVMLTPAFAVEMEEVAHEAEKYNEESQKKQSFFGKIKLIAKGFQLVDKAKKAEKDAEKKKDEEEDEVKGKDNDLFKKYDQKVLDKKEILEYLNDKNIANRVVNQTNNTNETDNTFGVMPNLPKACLNHIDSIIHFLTEQGLEASYSQNSAIDSSLIGKIAQLIDPNGNIHYAQITSLTADTVTLDTGEGTKEYSLEVFKKAFTGITIQTNDPNVILENINNKEKYDLDKERNKAQTIHDKARNQVILWGILIGIAIILITVGVILAMVYGCQLITAARKVPPYVAKIIDTKRAEVSLFNRYSRYNIKDRPFGTIEDFRKYAARMANRYYYDGDEELIPIHTADLLKCGISVTALGGLELAAFVASQNWVKVILCTVGLILILVGIGLITAGVLKATINGIAWHNANVLTRQNKEDTDNLMEWLTYDPVLNTTIT